MLDFWCKITLTWRSVRSDMGIEKTCSVCFLVRIGTFAVKGNALFVHESDQFSRKALGVQPAQPLMNPSRVAA